MKKQVLISIDPSSTCTGWCLFEYDNETCELLDSGAWALKKGNHTLEDRLDALYNNICGLCRDFTPDVAVYEIADVFTRKEWSGAKTQKAYRGAVDMCKAALWCSMGLEKCYGVSPQDWKGSKSKKTTINMVNYEYNLKLTEKDNDEADSIGIADAWLQRQGTNREYKSDKPK